MGDLHFSVETNPHQDYKHKADLLWKKHHKAKQKVLWFGLAISVILFVVGYRENTESVKTVAAALRLIILIGIWARR